MKFNKGLKRFLVLSVSILLTTGFSAEKVHAQNSEEVNIYVTNDRVNFRAEASLSSAVYKTLPVGKTVDIISFNGDGWAKVSVDNVEGFIKDEFLTERSIGIKTAAGAVELIEWSEAKTIFTTYTPAEIYDVNTGLTYYVQSFSNGHHADVETLTAEDTAIMLSTYGGSWSWDPRPVWVTIGGRTMAASINGMPHGGGTISGNNMNGQVCIHFKGSTTHNGNKSFAREHQNAVDEAWNARQ